MPEQQSNQISLNDAFNLVVELSQNLQTAKLRLATTKSQVELAEKDVEVYENRISGLLKDIAMVKNAQEKQVNQNVIAQLQNEKKNLEAQIKKGKKGLSLHRSEDLN